MASALSCEKGGGMKIPPPKDLFLYHTGNSALIMIDL